MIPPANDCDSRLRRRNPAFGADTQGLQNPPITETSLTKTSPSPYLASPLILIADPLYARPRDMVSVNCIVPIS
jgi:hypothetical protein